MQPIEELNTEEKARLLFELFPNKLTSYIDFLTGFTESQTSYKPQFKNTERPTAVLKQLLLPPVGLQDLLETEREALTRFIQYAAAMLFNEINAAYTVYCLEQFVTARIEDEKFTLAVQLLFL